MRKILLPTDFSQNSYNAIQHAVQLFERTESKFFLLHTLYNANYIVYSRLNSVYKNNSLKNLKKLKKRIITEHPNPNHQFELISTFNTLYSEISSMVADKEVDLIIMGTNGAAGGEELLFGTHTVHAIKIAKCPLLAIPSHSQYQSPKTILFATKYEIDFSEYQMDLLKRICIRHEAFLYIIHANFSGELTPNQEKAKQDLDDFFTQVPHDFHEVNENSVAEAIESFHKTHPVDLLVMIKHRQTFMERLLYSSVIHEIGLNSKFPFLVLPTEKYNPKEEE